ncbi:acetyl-CoA acetyltransferase [Bradyrhizobium prioriisuperbiae]|uniref:acetyl-CoA acetyltransferase n=1 Tax=Bradyrhizobium prioriisuperbiae TaxID=2854389 RepID=UPI0028EAF1A6|nr:acetyl-CoA acetyltransferase [Bradyrhizobium prioritasuperba]
MKSPVETPDDRIPVIVGVGERLDRPTDPAKGLEPLALMAAALQNAERDAGASLLARIDSLDVVNFVSWRYHTPEQLLCRRLGIAPARAVYGPVGGESPVRYLHEAALRIARGESQVGAICGAEAQSTVAKAEKAGFDLPWTPYAHDAPAPVRGASYQHPMSVKLGVARPMTAYPFYDAASATHWGQAPREALRESGELWARYAATAADNPSAWIRRAVSADTIATPSPDNRLIAWPYTKLMVANPTVNQGAAILITSLKAAREAAIPDSKMIHVWGSAWAIEPRDFLNRDQFHRSDCQDAVLETAMDIAGGDGKAFDALELYSCFPCVPKMARRTLGLGADVQPTVTGGLTFFGAPLNNYMTHAACAMVRRLRGGAKLGLLYGQGEYVTKHHALVLSSQPSRQPLAQDASVQATADRRRGPVPAVVTEASGTGTVETFTVIYQRTGEVQHGVVILRTADGSRTLARVCADDTRTLARLTDLDRSPIGLAGPINGADDGLLEWHADA